MYGSGSLNTVPLNRFTAIKKDMFKNNNFKSLANYNKPEPAQGALDRMFGKNIASGNKFRTNFKSPATTKLQMTMPKTKKNTIVNVNKNVNKMFGGNFFKK